MKANSLSLKQRALQLIGFLFLYLFVSTAIFPQKSFAQVICDHSCLEQKCKSCDDGNPCTEDKCLFDSDYVHGGYIFQGCKHTNVCPVWYKDADKDLYYSVTDTTSSSPGPDWSVLKGLGGGDCNDNNSSIHPGATEVCNGLDDNCDGQIDEGVKSTFYRDADNDGYGDPVVTMQACSQPAGYVNNNSDCDDSKVSVHPGAEEICNGIDDNCDGIIDGATLTEVSRKDSLAGIFCPEADQVELKFSAPGNYDKWYLQETSLAYFGETASWSADKDQTIVASLTELRKPANKYHFIAYVGNVTCVAEYAPSGFNNKGCDGKIHSRLIRPESSPGANNAVCGFLITTSACTSKYGDPWVIVLKDVNTGKVYPSISDNPATTIGGLHAGTYSVSFGDHAAVCSYLNSATIAIPLASSTNKNNEAISLNNANSNRKVFKIAVAPNPAGHSSTLYITSEKAVSILISDLEGKTLWRRDDVTGNSVMLPLENFANGTYIVTVNNGLEKKTLKLMKEK